MLRRSLFGTAVLVAALFPSLCLAGIASGFGGADVLAPGRFAVGGEFLGWVDPYDAGGIGYVGYGLIPAVQMGAALGHTGRKPYFAAETRFRLGRSRTFRSTGPRFTTVLGVHHDEAIGIDLAMYVSSARRWGAVSYGIDFDVDYTKPETTYPTHLLFGFERPVGRSLRAVGTFGVDLRDSQNYCTFGLTYFP